MSQYKYATVAVHAGQRPDPLAGAVNVPVYLSSTFELTGVGTDRGWDYSRAGNPTRDRSETGLAAPEGGVSGHAFQEVVDGLPKFRKGRCTSVGATDPKSAWNQLGAIPNTLARKYWLHWASRSSLGRVTLRPDGFGLKL
jgi:hypothetical protein